MKIKIFFLLILSILFGILINKNNELIKIPKEERQLIQTSEKIIKGNVIKFDDGDSFVLDSGAKIRLFGIDAPELSQICNLLIENTNKNNEIFTKTEEIKCGEIAKNKLIAIISNNEVFCSIKGKDAYDRFVSECNINITNSRTKRKNAININKEMVLSGNAVAFQQISEKYLEDENRARSENKGIWETTFDLPSVYRKKNNK